MNLVCHKKFQHLNFYSNCKGLQGFRNQFSALIQNRIKYHFLHL